MLLYWKPVAELHTQKLKSDIWTYFSDWKHYVAILFFGTNSSSAVYVRNKQAFAQKIWLPAFIFWQEHKEQNLWIFEDLSEDIVRRYENTDQVFNLIYVHIPFVCWIVLLFVFLHGSTTLWCLLPVGLSGQLFRCNCGLLYLSGWWWVVAVRADGRWYS